MAYFSGNAIYIRSTISQLRNSDPTFYCGGVNIIDNTFANNIGMKSHNGGAISASCFNIDSSHIDYGSLSEIPQTLN